MPENEQPVMQQSAPTTPVSTPGAKTTKATALHDSNPFTTTLRGIKKLFAHNTKSLIGVVLISIVAGAITIATVIAMLFALLAYVLRSAETALNYVIRPEIIENAASFSDAAIYTTWIVGALLVIVLVAFLHVIQIKLVAVSSEGTTIGFGALFKESWKRMLPFIGLIALLGGAQLVLLILLSMLSPILGPIMFVLMLIYALAVIYVAMRILFAAFSVVDEKLGPIAAIKRSWALTKGHFAEALGVAAATMIIVVVPISIIELLSFITYDLISAILALGGVLLSLILGTIMFAGFAERFVQLRNLQSGAATATSTHVLNYLAPIGFIVCMFIISAIAPKPAVQTLPAGQQLPTGEQVLPGSELQLPPSEGSELEEQELFMPHGEQLPAEQETEPAYNFN